MSLDTVDPMFNAGMGAVYLLDNLLQLAAGYLLNEDLQSYFNTLEAIYIELIYIEFP